MGFPRGQLVQIIKVDPNNVGLYARAPRDGDGNIMSPIFAMLNQDTDTISVTGEYWPVILLYPVRPQADEILVNKKDLKCLSRSDAKKIMEDYQQVVAEYKRHIDFLITYAPPQHNQN